MDFNKLTTKSQEAIAGAQELARKGGNPEIHPEHPSSSRSRASRSARSSTSSSPGYAYDLRNEASSSTSATKRRSSSQKPAGIRPTALVP